MASEGGESPESQSRTVYVLEIARGVQEIRRQKAQIDISGVESMRNYRPRSGIAVIAGIQHRR